jgi:lactate permease
VWLFAILGLFWRLAGLLGLCGTAATCAAEVGWIAALGTLLIGAHWLLPVELCGIAATGPLLVLRHRDRLADPAARRAALPYLLLTLALLGTRLLPGIGPWLSGHAWQPFAGLPAFALNHVSVVLGLVALALLAQRTDPLAIMRSALGRARRPALAMLLFVLLARWLSTSGIAENLARALAGAAGPLAPFTAPLLATAAGFFIGTNVGSNSATMPLVAALSAGTSLPPALLPAIQNFCGSASVLLAPPVLTLAAGIFGERIAPRAVWRLIWPLAPAAIAVGWAAIAAAALPV